MKKRKKNMIMLGIFMTGILLIGMGTGIAFGEYSGLEYGGETVIPVGTTEKIGLEQQITTGKKAKKTLLYCYYGNDDFEIKEDEDIPEGIVRCEVTCNTEYVKPDLSYEKYDSGYEEEGESYEGGLYLSTYQVKDELKLFMEYKDEILNDLKNKKIASYLYDPVEKVVVKVNPKTRKYLKVIS